MSPWQGAWQHAGRCGSGEITEISIFRPAGREGHWDLLGLLKP